MAKPLSGYVFVAGVGYVPKFDINQVYTNTKSTSSSTQVITTTGEKKKVSFDKIFGYLEKAVGLFGTVAEGIRKIKAGSLPEIQTNPDLLDEPDWLGANPNGVRVDENGKPESKQSLNIDISTTNILLGIGGFIVLKKSKLI